ncbi:MAG: hypothetical protein HY887_01670 [Deltaproteobacteria bacterium]|nr:hypothetical protein [Deltaproteobacteria bacterium]
MRNLAFAIMFVLIAALAGCAGLNFSQMSPEVKDFHPRTIAVLPATIGEHESARDVVEAVVAKKLSESMWYGGVVDAAAVKKMMAESKDLSDNVQNYLQQVNTLGTSDAALTQKFRDGLQVDALFLTYVTAWEYGRMEGNKVAKVGLGIKLVDAATGVIVWKANHELVDEYLAVKPSLDRLSEKLMKRLMKEMPH